MYYSNIEHAYYELTGHYEAFEGLCFVDTLDLTRAETVNMFSPKNTQRVQRQRNAPITIVIGNPPYNMGQSDENDNNKNRKYKEVDQRIKDTYIQDASGTLKRQYYDAYVKFFRWSTDRLSGRDGIVCFVTNNNFVQDLDGLRKHFLRDFTAIYHVDLHGNVNQNPELSGTTHNVFGIKNGVGITIAVRRSSHSERQLFYLRVPENWTRGEKLEWLAQITHSANVIKTTGFVRTIPDKSARWILNAVQTEFDALLPLSSSETKSAVFAFNVIGVSTNRDNVVYDFETDALLTRVKQFCDDYNLEVDRFKRQGNPKQVDDFVSYSKIDWSDTLKKHLIRGDYTHFDSARLRVSLWRPFTKKHWYYDRTINDRASMSVKVFPNNLSEEENQVIACTCHSQSPFIAQIVRSIPDASLGGRPTQCFPFFVYDEDGRNRRENITDWALTQFQARYGDGDSSALGIQHQTLTKWDIFYYVYGLLHHPEYRTRYADNLKRELPRIPFVPSAADFWAFAEAGRKLADLHLNYESVPPYPLEYVWTPGKVVSYRVDKMHLQKPKGDSALGTKHSELIFNDSLTLRGIPADTFEYRLGNRSALKWVIDQYQVKTDKRSGITSDPNQYSEDEQYIVKLVGRVVNVSVQTVEIVRGLAAVALREAVAGTDSDTPAAD